MQDIKEFSLEELGNILKSWDKPPFHSRQIFSWIYKKGAQGFEKMSELPLDLRKKLKENFDLFSFKLVKILQSRDGTKKFLFALRDKNLIEGVIIPTQKRITGCISTQVGCRFACHFCASGIAGFKRNLTCAEMIEEVLLLENHSLDKKLTHIVFMGIGEPLDNYENVIKVARIINLKSGLNIAARRITISTCGIIPGIKKLSEVGLQIELSISLHAADDKTRALLMPINRKYPLKDLMQASKEYIEKTKRQITFEYVLIKGITSDLQNALNLSKILKNLRLCKVNIIPCNTIKELNVEPPKNSEILLFRDYLLKAGIHATLRKPRGQDIEAACGQLRLRYEKE